MSLTPNPIGEMPTGTNLLVYRRGRADEIRLVNRACIDESELGRLYAEGLTLLKTPVVRLAQIQPDGSSDRLKVLTTCAVAVYDLALAGFDVIEQGHTTLLPDTLRDIDEWSLILLAVIADDTIAARLMTNRLVWKKDVESVAKTAWPANIGALLKDWGGWSGLVHHERRISVNRYWPKGLNGPSLLVGANLDCRKTLVWLVNLCTAIGNHLLILRNWDGLQGLSNTRGSPNTDDTWREAIDSWRVKFEDPAQLLP